MCSENHAWSADAALGSAFVEETLLDWVKFFVEREAFDSCDFSAFSLQNRDEAGVDEAPIDQDCAGSTFAFAAAFLGPSKVKVLAKNIEEPLHWWSLNDFFRPVDDELHFRHGKRP